MSIVVSQLSYDNAKSAAAAITSVQAPTFSNVFYTTYTPGSWPDSTYRIVIILDYVISTYAFFTVFNGSLPASFSTDYPNAIQLSNAITPDTFKIT